jgi:hypothetical protein
MKNSAGRSRAPIVGTCIRLVLGSIAMLTGFDGRALAAYGAGDLAGAWRLHGLISGDSPDQHPGWFWMSLAFDSSGNGSATSTVHDSLGNAYYNSTLGRYAINGAGAVTSERIDSFHGVMNAGKDLLMAVATMAPGDWDDVRGYNLQIFTKAGATFTTSNLAGTWRLHGLISGDAPQFTSWMHGTVTASANGSFSYSIYDVEGPSPETGSAVASLTSDGVFTVPGDPSAHGVMSNDKSLVVFTMNDGGGGHSLCIMQKRSTATFSANDLPGIWHLHGLAAGDSPQWTGWLRGDAEVRSSGRLSVALVRSDGSTDRMTDTVQISSDGVITLAGVPSAHGVMSDDKSLVVLTITEIRGGYDLLILSRAAKTLSFHDYGAGTPQEHGVKTFAWTYGQTGQWTSQIGRAVTVHYGDGSSLAGVEMTNTFEVNGALWDEVVGANGSVINVLALGDFYLSSDEHLTSHPDVWSFGTVADGTLFALRPYYIIRTDPDQVGGRDDQMLLYHVQDIDVPQGHYADALAAWTIDVRYPYVDIDLFGRDADLGLVLPTSLETAGYAVAGFRMQGRDTGVIGLGRIDPQTGQLQSLGELTDISPVGVFTIGGSIYTDLNAPLTSGLAGVRVMVTGPGGTFEATTDDLGLWSVANVPEAGYDVTPSKIGHTFQHVAGGVADGQASVPISVDAAHEAENQSIQFMAGEAPVTRHDWNGDGIVSIIGDVPPFVQCVYFGNCPPGAPAVGDCNHDGILSIIGDVPCFVDCVYFGNCSE